MRGPGLGRGGRRPGWERWVGDQGTSVSIERYGASAPIATVLEKLGITPENVAMHAAALLERVA